ncbi:serine hydrolase domain-containing protein [Phyllobacterium sp. P30BS-XVII]|uniref:serine hydrolase domain-containing protein n=1 Tax=Phyllobacterium sp. P30BS-XVII TaxID=2587046 RepID=UPI0015F9C401|nr:serine hydrolase domain-containing protein [Phyllobacterium sp. P30BS-XVII]MBA8901416.1 CubicO group peptidase (beta-lactamase class C family) [Phyllobacterium sp. P30BS-XVII]
MNIPVAASLTTLSPITPTLAVEASFKGRLDKVIDEAIADQTIVGTVILVAEDGNIVYRRAAGFADREAKTLIKEDTIFRVASLTKPIVAVTALRLVEEGKLKLDDPVTTYLPDFRPKTADGREAVITIRQLMSHTSGLTYGFLQPADGPYLKAGVSDGLDQPGLSIEENLRRIASVPLSHEPGTAWGYSVGLDVLGAVLAKATGKSLPELVKENVTGKLGMDDTGFTVTDMARLAVAYGDGEPPVRMGKAHSVPFIDGDVSFATDRIFDPASYASGGAGMAGTADDYIRFLEALRNGGSPLLKADSLKLLESSQIGDLVLDVAPPGTGFSLGFSIVKDPAAAGSPQSAGTWRWGGVYGQSWFVDPVRKLTVVALTNTAYAGMIGAFPDGVRDAIYGN